MKLTADVQYTINVICKMSDMRQWEVSTVSTLSQECSIPKPFLEQIMRKLKIDGIMSVKRGPGGGYRLNVDPQSISMARVYKALNKKVVGDPIFVTAISHTLNNLYLDEFLQNTTTITKAQENHAQI